MKMLDRKSSGGSFEVVENERSESSSRPSKPASHPAALQRQGRTGGQEQLR